MQLSAEDQLKLNVMMAQKPRAVRIDENRMQVFALTKVGEARIDLNTNEKPIPYLRRVREFLSGYVIDSPGGYPIHIPLWTRMGQIKEENLPQLLMLGETEAVMAVVHAKRLTAEIGHCAWWCMPESDNARSMLEKEAIASSDLGPILAEHLFEHLAFETQPRETIESVRLILQPGLLSKDKLTKLWQSSQRNHAILVGFLQSASASASMLHEQSQHDAYDALNVALQQLDDNKYGREVLWCLSANGQGFLFAAYSVLQKPKTQALVIYLLNTINDKFRGLFPLSLTNPSGDIDEISRLSEALVNRKSEEFASADTLWQQLIVTIGEEKRLLSLLASLLWMAQLSSAVVTPILVKTSAEGTLMRRKLQPVTDRIFEQFAGLLDNNQSDIQ